MPNKIHQIHDALLKEGQCTDPGCWALANWIYVHKVKAKKVFNATIEKLFNNNDKHSTGNS